MIWNCRRHIRGVLLLLSRMRSRILLQDLRRLSRKECTIQAERSCVPHYRPPRRSFKLVPKKERIEVFLMHFRRSRCQKHFVGSYYIVHNCGLFSVLLRQEVPGLGYWMHRLARTERGCLHTVCFTRDTFIRDIVRILKNKSFRTHGIVKIKIKSSSSRISIFYDSMSSDCDLSRALAQRNPRQSL